MLPISQSGKSKALPQDISSSHVASQQRLRSSVVAHNNTATINVNNNNTTEVRITNKNNNTCSVDDKTNQKTISTTNKNSTRMSSTPLTLSMATLPVTERTRIPMPMDSASDGDINFISTEQQLEKIKKRNVTKKPFFEKTLGETENFLWSTSSPSNTSSVKPLSPNCHLRWSFSQGRETTQLPATSQANNDLEKIVATGTIWTPSISNKNLRSIQSSLAMIPTTNSAPLLTLKKIPSLNTKQMASTNHFMNRSPPKEVEASYQDPLAGAPNTFLLRVNEISNLETETVRQERSRKLKKKNKYDRDSSGY